VDTKALVPELQQQDQASRCHGLPPRAGRYEGDLHPYGADRYAPTDPRAFAARLDLITASEYKDALRACADMDDLHDLRACIWIWMTCAPASP